MKKMEEKTLQLQEKPIVIISVMKVSLVAKTTARLLKRQMPTPTSTERWCAIIGEKIDQVNETHRERFNVFVGVFLMSLVEGT